MGVLNAELSYVKTFIVPWQGKEGERSCQVWVSYSPMAMQEANITYHVNTRKAWFEFTLARSCRFLSKVSFFATVTSTLTSNLLWKAEYKDLTWLTSKACICTEAPSCLRFVLFGWRLPGLVWKESLCWNQSLPDVSLHPTLRSTLTDSADYFWGYLELLRREGSCRWWEQRYKAPVKRGRYWKTHNITLIKCKGALGQDLIP